MDSRRDETRRKIEQLLGKHVARSIRFVTARRVPSRDT